MRYVPSTTVLSMAVYGASGLAFVGANLLLARALSTEQYAYLTLIVALATLGYHLAPAGLDAIVLRGRLEAGPPLLKRLGVAAGAIAIIASGAAFLVYGISSAMAVLLLSTTAAGGLMLVAAARFQSQQRFPLSLALVTSPNLLLLLGAATTTALGARTATPALIVLTLGLVAVAAVGWSIVLRESRQSMSPVSVPWAEAFVLAGVGAAVMLFIQLERLVIPHVLSATELALFGVLGAIVGSLFRLLQMGVGYGLLPRLRGAASVVERRKLVAAEVRFAVAIAGTGAVAILFLTPVVERLFLAGKYHLPTALIVAAIFSGIAKIAHAFARVAATALATPRELKLVNGAGWFSIALALGAAFAAAPWGLTGVIYAVGLGWLAWAGLSFSLVLHHLRLPAGAPARG